MIYLIHINAWDGETSFYDLTDEEIKEMYEKDKFYIRRYESIEQLAADWNDEDIFYPNMSYMRVINN